VQPGTIALIVFVCVFGGALLGLWLGARLPARHVDKPTQDMVKLGMGTIATLMALVLGLLVATAKASFDTTATETRQFAARLVELDHVLARYGPETATARRLLRQFAALKVAELWPEGGRRPASQLYTDTDALLERAGDELFSLSPHDEVQKSVKTLAMRLAGQLGETRWLLVLHAAGNAIPGPFLIVLIFWATILFISFGLFAPRHGTSIAVLFVCALSIAAAIFIILEMNYPFIGIIRISSAPARTALQHLH
jgi:hypothetical protein